MKYYVDNTNISDISAHILDALKADKLSDRENAMAELLIEEVCMNVFSEAKAEQITISICHSIGKVSLLFEYCTVQYNPLDKIVQWQDEDDEQKQIVRRIFNAYKSRFSYTVRSGINRLSLLLHEDTTKSVVLTLGAMVLGIIVGLILKNTVPDSALAILNTNVFSLIKSLFLNALKMVIAPVVFFSITSSVSEISSTSEIGKIAGKILGLYALTTLLAIAVGFATAPIATLNLMPMEIEKAVETVSASAPFEFTFAGFIKNIIPTNLAAPILNGDMIQIIFISGVVGVAVCMLGASAKPIQNFLSSGNKLFLQIVNIIMVFMPLVAFCSMVEMIVSIGTSSLSVLLRIIAAFLAGTIAMAVIYIVILTVFSKLSPFPFIRKASVYFLTPFSLASSNASIPSTIKFCEEKLGISPKIPSFSIPIGAVINMDNTCVYLIVCSCTFLKLIGVELTPVLIGTISILTFALSIGAPGVASAGLICLATIMPVLNIPIEYISIVMGIDAFFSMCRAGFNTLGDIAMTTVLAKAENSVDEKIYKST